MIIDLLEHPIIKNLNETEASLSKMEARFERRRGKIHAHISKWRLQTEGHLAELIRKGREDEGLEEAPDPILPVKKSMPNPFDNISDDLNLLLRADSLFESTRGPLATPLTYSSLISSPEPSVYALLREQRLDLTRYKRHAEAQKSARVLLEAMGIPDASFLELKSVGPGFMCGRCHSDSMYTWEEMVCPSFIVRMVSLTGALIFRFGTIQTRNALGNGFRLGFR